MNILFIILGVVISQVITLIIFKSKSSYSISSNESKITELLLEIKLLHDELDEKAAKIDSFVDKNSTYLKKIDKLSDENHKYSNDNSILRVEHEEMNNTIYNLYERINKYNDERESIIDYALLFMRLTRNNTKKQFLDKYNELSLIYTKDESTKRLNKLLMLSKNYLESYFYNKIDSKSSTPEKRA